MRVYVLVLALLAGCATNPMAGARYWTVEQCATAPQENIRFLNPDGSVLAVVPRKTCQAVASASEKIQAQAHFTLWRTYIASVEQRNAFATTDKQGHSVAVVTIGMVQALGPDEDAWAGLLGHEVAHHVKRHSEGRKEAQANARATGQATANVIGAVIPGFGGLIASTVGGTATQMAMYGAYTRPQEAEADSVGLQWMVDAGYDPQGMLRLFSKLAETSSSSDVFSFLSTHPANADRRQAVERFIASHNRPAVVAVGTPRAKDVAPILAQAPAPAPASAPIVLTTAAVARQTVVPKSSDIAPSLATTTDCVDATEAVGVKAACLRGEDCQQQISLITKHCAQAAKTLCVGAQQQLPSFCVKDSKAYDEGRCDYAVRSVANYCRGSVVATAPVVTAMTVAATSPAIAKTSDIAPSSGATNDCSAATETPRVKTACSSAEACQQHITAIKRSCAHGSKTLCVAAQRQLPTSCVRDSKAYDETACDYAARSVGNYCRD